MTGSKMPKEKVPKKPKPAKVPRGKYVFPCSTCGADVGYEVTCGYCKDQTGIRTIHRLCDPCFMKGCPVLVKKKSPPVVKPTPFILATSNPPPNLWQEYLLDVENEK